MSIYEVFSLIIGIAAIVIDFIMLVIAIFDYKKSKK